MIFFRKKNIFLGVDFGSHMVKVVEVTFKNQRPHLTNYAYTVIPSDGDVGTALSETIKKMKPATRSAYAALPGSSGLVTVITFPRMSDSDLSKAVMFEARKHIPIPLKDVNISWDVITHVDSNNKKPENLQSLHEFNGENNKETVDESDKSVSLSKDFDKKKFNKKSQKNKEYIKVLLVAAPRKDVSKYEEHISKASLNLSALELETFSLVRSLVGKDSGTFLIIDIGAKATNIILVKQEIIQANRNVGVGSEAITQSLMQSLGVDFDRADKYKKEQDNTLADTGSARPIVDNIIEEARRVIANDSSNSIDSVILSGGGSLLSGVDKYISDALGIKVVNSTPWSRIIIDPKIAPYIDKIKGSFSVAAGLALRGAEEYQRNH